MKTFYVLVLLCAFGLLRSQTLMTNRMMHNYNVGDTIQWSTPFDLCYEPSSYQERVVLQKQLNATSVKYTFKDTYKPMCGPNCIFQEHVLTYNVQVDNLDSAAVFLDTAAYIHCTYHLLTDTLYINQALSGRRVYKRKYNFHPDSTVLVNGCKLNGTAQMIEGIGEFYTMTLTSNGDPCHRDKVLEFYHKVGENPYGHRVIQPPSVPAEEKLLVYPTIIADHVLKIDYQGEGNLELLISGVDGRIMKEQEIVLGANAITLNLNPGLYFLKFFSDNSFNGAQRKIIIK